MIKVEKNIAGRPLKIESGQIARQAGGSVFISCLLYTSDAADED